MQSFPLAETLPCHAETLPVSRRRAWVHGCIKCMVTRKDSNMCCCMASPMRRHRHPSGDAAEHASSESDCLGRGAAEHVRAAHFHFIFQFHFGCACSLAIQKHVDKFCACYSREFLDEFSKPCKRYPKEEQHKRQAKTLRNLLVLRSPAAKREKSLLQSLVR